MEEQLTPSEMQAHEFRKWYTEKVESILDEYIPPKTIDAISDKILPIIEARLPNLLKETIKDAIRQAVLEGWRQRELEKRGIKE